MPRALLLSADLLFGSKVQSMVRELGYELDTTSGEDEARAAAPNVDLLIVDLTADSYDGVVLVDSMKAGAEIPGVKTLGYYAHTDTETKQKADAAGFDLVVPRSRMNREGPQLIKRLLVR